MPRLEGRHTHQSRQLGIEGAAVNSSTDSYTRSAARAAAISLATIGGSHVPGPGMARHEYRGRCGVPCAAAHGAQSRAGRGDASGGRKGSGDSHSSSGNDGGRGGGRVAPSCPEPVKSLRLYSAKTDSHPLPDPPVRGPPPPAASPCAGVRVRRPRSGAVPPHPQPRHELVGMGGWRGGGRPSDVVSRTCLVRRRL